MPRINLYAIVVMVLAAWVVPTQANAFACLKNHKPFQLSGDSVQYAMAISPGKECIQGLRWSFMQVYAVWLLKKPVHGEVVMVGPGFRYIAKSDSGAADKFSLLVVGKNGLEEEGYSTVEVTVSQPAVAPEAGSPATDVAPQAHSGPEPKAAKVAVVH